MLSFPTCLSECNEESQRCCFAKVVEIPSFGFDTSTNNLWLSLSAGSSVNDLWSSLRTGSRTMLRVFCSVEMKFDG